MTAKENLISAVAEGRTEDAEAGARQALSEGLDVHALVQELTAAMREVGARFERLEIFLPEMMASAEAMMAAMEVLRPALEGGAGDAARATVVMGTTRGDMHEIGKNIVGVMLKANGFQVVDLGPNVDPLVFIKRAAEAGAAVVGISTLMTTTMPAAREVIELMKEYGVRDRYKVMVGGAPTSAAWAKEIGADGWAEDAAGAAALAMELVGGGR
ncbi:MAG: cobalamin-dependent protein [Acetobacteraceae bacterium]|nr:cobalamin-dependent protein [Acetobacteraceae bacterium]